MTSENRRPQETTPSLPPDDAALRRAEETLAGLPDHGDSGWDAQTPREQLIEDSSEAAPWPRENAGSYALAPEAPRAVPSRKSRAHPLHKDVNVFKPSAAHRPPFLKPGTVTSTQPVASTYVYSGPKSPGSR